MNMLKAKTGDTELVTITREDYNATKQRLAELEAALTKIANGEHAGFISHIRYIAKVALKGKRE